MFSPPAPPPPCPGTYTRICLHAMENLHPQPGMVEDSEAHDQVAESERGTRPKPTPTSEWKSAFKFPLLINGWNSAHYMVTALPETKTHAGVIISETVSRAQRMPTARTLTATSSARINDPDLAAAFYIETTKAPYFLTLVSQMSELEPLVLNKFFVPCNYCGSPTRTSSPCGYAFTCRLCTLSNRCCRSCARRGRVEMIYVD